MKRIIRFIVCVCLCSALLTAQLCLTPASAADKFFSKADMLLIRNHVEEDGSQGVYATVQGACTDGKYAYLALMNGGATILKYDIKSWEFVEKKKISNVGHANDMTYNPDKGYIVIANNAPYYDILTLLDPDKLEVIKDVQIKEDIYSIAYNPSRKQYVVGISGGYNFAYLDEDFNIIKDEDKVRKLEEEKQTEKYKKLTDKEKEAKEKATNKVYEGVKTGYTRQGCDCDDNYIYFVQSGGNNIIVVYDYSGNHVATVPMASTDEIENIFHIGNTYYTTMFYYGNRILRVGFNDSTKITYKVYYDANGGSGEMEPTTVTYGEKTKLRKCGFTKPGYFFAGWTVQRDSDGKYIGYANGASDYGWLPGGEVYNRLLYYDEEPMSETVKFGNVRLSAVWINERYVIEFDTDGGEGYMEPVSVAYGEEYSLPVSSFKKEGYVFDGYSASRDLDGRSYGYRAGSDKAEWLESADIDRLHLFHPGDSVKELTEDGTATFTTRYKFAYTFGDDGSTLVEYVGVDEKVVIPDNSGELKTLAGGAIKDNDNMTELYIPAGVRDMQKQAVTNCPKLRNIYFEGSLPEKFDPQGVSGADNPAVFKVRDGQAFCIGFYTDEAGAALIKCHAFSLDENLKQNKLAR